MFSDARVAAGEAAALAERVAFIDDIRLGIESATLTLKLRGGATLSHHVGAARGSLAAPLTDAGLESKLTELARWGRSGCAVAPLIDALWSLDDSADAASLMHLARPPGSRA